MLAQQYLSEAQASGSPWQITDPLLSDNRVRQAMNYAIDRQALDDAVFNFGAIKSNFIPPENWAFNADALSFNDRPKGERVIDIACDAGATSVRLAVRDNGIGIDPQYHDQIFRMFRRLHRREEIEGTGAGLAICKRIVEAHGGRIWVESEPGAGATFVFTLPRLAPAPPAAAPVAPSRRTEVAVAPSA